MSGRPDFETGILGERQNWVAAGPDGKLGPPVTLTDPALESSGTAAFLVAGAEKHEMLARLRDGDRDLPAARLAAAGKMRLFADTAPVGRSVP
jgi:6-phosphogluconolactonase